jgi:hypothetical protein
MRLFGLVGLIREQVASSDKVYPTFERYTNSATVTRKMTHVLAESNIQLDEQTALKETNPQAVPVLVCPQQ